MLFAADRHEPLANSRWDASQAQQEIAAIIADTEAAHARGGWWAHHPRDDTPAGSVPNKTLYLGAAGVIWGLEHLAGKKAATLSRSYEGLWSAAYADYMSLPDTEAVVPSWFVGRSALLLGLMLRGPAPQRQVAADRLYEVVADNCANPTWELLWGSPGTMLAALFAFEATGEARWRELYVRNADRLWDEWAWSDHLDCHIWTQDLYQNVGIYLGAGHGFVGNAFALLRGRAHLPEARREALIPRIVRTTTMLAVREGGLVNWPAWRGTAAVPARAPTLLQWCHGAPGFLMSLTRLPAGQDRALDQLLLDAGELIWTAGPLKKGACFCHGTDGNGMALLTLFERTGDPLWLGRARQMAMHAIGQSRRNLAAIGMRRFTLWTGDLGLAIYLQACLEGKALMPALDSF